ncbi:DNA double-strand break repair protein Mre11 [Halomicrobium salinisoli]|uniref:DNA double-strand break repair protein Mre11 n=1 Tax=Halomicrobium salinisoli TaxID=2878391 RepID=UPI001CF0580C|nr:DNA double-strand break repair protein Mre11 [Halomicrobium salinisoli]
MTRVIHTGDTHLGYQQYHVPERREDFVAAFRQVAADAVDGDVDAVVHAGDLFHDRRPTLTDVLDTLEVLRRLDDAGVPFLAVVGNHEAKRDAQWLDLFASMGLATRLGDEPTVVGDVAFYGLDYVPRSQREALEYDFAPHEADHAALVTHGQFNPFDYGTWDAEEILAEATVDFDALLLGDEHAAETKQVEDTWLTYCGSTERASADERDDRGYNVVTFEGDVAIARRGLDTREFVYVEVDLAEGEGVDRVRERVGQHDLEDAVVIVHVDGAGDPITPAAVEEFALDRGALVARVTDHREFADESGTEVSFADPDDAVRQRVRELGLSEAARDLDETIRASKVADANVADAVEDRVRELVDDGDADAFAPAPAEEGEADVPDDGAATTTGDDLIDGGDDAVEAADGGAESTADDRGGPDGAEQSVTGDGDAESTGDSPAEDPEDQSTMEEYL